MVIEFSQVRRRSEFSVSANAAPANRDELRIVTSVSYGQGSQVRLMGRQIGLPLGI
jgi:hypothetical protein